MTRSISSAAAAQLAAASSSPCYLVRAELGGSVGEKWWSDRARGLGDGSSWENAAGIVSRWGALSCRLNEDPRYTPLGDTWLELLDDNVGTLHGFMRSVEFQNRRVRIYLSFTGLDRPHLIQVFDGIINDAPAWQDSERKLLIHLTDSSTRFNRTIGNAADRSAFPGIGAWDEDKMLPIVFGKQKRSPCVAANTGPMCRLARRCGWADMRLIMDDAEHFPQDTLLSIRIDNEIITGTFSGNTFTAVQRSADIITNYTVDAATDTLSFDDLSLAPHDAAYVGYWVYLEHPGIFGGYAFRRIIAYDGALRRVFYQYPPFIVNGAEYALQPGDVYSITSRSNKLGYAHKEGADVYLVQPGYVYIVADHPVKSVDAVEGYGTTKQVYGEGDQLREIEKEGYIPFDKDWYTVNTFDTTSFPQLGRPVTTLTFSKMPRELLPTLRDNRLWADVQGAESQGDGSGSVLENPADIIAALLTRPRWGGVPGYALNAASFATARTQLAYLRMAFTLTRQRDLLDLIADLAWQARSAMNWNDGAATLAVLANNAGAPALTLDDTRFALGSLAKQSTSLREITSEICAAYTDRLEEKHVSLRDAAVESACERRVAVRRFWAYRTRNDVINAAAFWLNRMKRIYEIVRLRAFLDAVVLERGDTVALDYPDLFAPDQRGTVVALDQSPGGGEAGLPPAVDVTLRLPVAAGCATACEAHCETGGCESGCEFACELAAESCWRCETSCEQLAELVCATTQEIYCSFYDIGCGESGECGACETSCTTDCELLCESACETACESGCEAACEGLCETGCESACEISCESRCETSACEVGCETGCEVTCQTGCETSCETACEQSCEAGCEVECQSGCETSCETACEQSCEAGCESGCQAVCETGCETPCETGCETGCETDAESGAPISGWYCVELHEWTQSGSCSGTPTIWYQCRNGADWAEYGWGVCVPDGGKSRKYFYISGPYASWDECRALSTCD